jgi:hypothetical protein
MGFPLVLLWGLFPALTLRNSRSPAAQAAWAGYVSVTGASLFFSMVGNGSYGGLASAWDAIWQGRYGKCVIDGNLEW